MATAKITLFGMYNYMEESHDPLFTYLNTPAGIDKDVLIQTILLRGGEFEVLYADGYFMQTAIKTWSDKWQHTMKRWIDALNISYNPLENYDRMEEWTDENNKNEKVNRVESAMGHDNSVSSGNGLTENTRSAFDASDYSPHDKSTSASNGSNESNSLTNATGQTTDEQNETNKRSGRAHGNIGVTTSQQMLQSELDISRFNIYDEIADLFCSELCIFTY